MADVDNLKKQFQESIAAANLDVEGDIDPALERPKDEANGDFASTIALRLSKQLGKNPREIAQAIVDNFPTNSIINKIEIAGPGFINVYLNNESVSSIVEKIRSEKMDFARDCAKGMTSDVDKKINLEYISANPTGPMHVGHGR